MKYNSPLFVVLGIIILTLAMFTLIRWLLKIKFHIKTYNEAGGKKGRFVRKQIKALFIEISCAIIFSTILIYAAMHTMNKGF